MAKRKYRVNASTPVLGNEPGSKFEADLDPTLEARLLAGGALEADSDAPVTPDVALDEDGRELDEDEFDYDQPDPSE